MPEPGLRLDLYARLAGLGSEDEADELEEEIADRFGMLPTQAEEFLAVARLNLRCRRMETAKLEAGPAAGYGATTGAVVQSNVYYRPRCSPGGLGKFPNAKLRAKKQLEIARAVELEPGVQVIPTTHPFQRPGDIR